MQFRLCSIFDAFLIYDDSAKYSCFGDNLYITVAKMVSLNKTVSLLHSIAIVFKFNDASIARTVYQRLRDGWPGFNSQQGQKILFSTESRPTLGPTQPLIQWVLGALYPAVKRPGREADHSHLVPRSRKMELHLHYPVLLHGVMLG
jgi:hypothetical protein